MNLIVELLLGLTGWDNAATFIETNTSSLLIVRDTGSGSSRFIHLKVSRL